MIQQKGKTRITIYLDDDVIEQFRKRSDAAGYGYQTMINEALREVRSANLIQFCAAPCSGVVGTNANL